MLLRARAIEAGCVVIAAAQGGAHADGRTTYGHSLVVDPWGDVLLEPTRLYTRPLLDAIAETGDAVHALSHVTGGGIAAVTVAIVRGIRSRKKDVAR